MNQSSRKRGKSFSQKKQEPPAGISKSSCDHAALSRDTTEPPKKKPEKSLHSAPPLGVLDPLLADLVEARRKIKKTLNYSPEELQCHRIHVMYVDRILDVLKARQQSKNVDRDQLLLESLETVVRFLLERGETDCARVLGDHLEEIGQKVKRAWNQSDNHPVLPGAMPESGPPSAGPSPPSPGTGRKTSADEGTGL